MANKIWSDYKTEAISCGFGLLVLVALVISSYVTDLDPNAAVQSFTLVVLVIVTIVYAKAIHKTYKATSEQVNTTKEAVRVAVDSERNSFAPIVLLTLRSYGTSGIDAQFENIGRGPALNLSVWLEKPEDSSFDYLENKSKKHNAIVKMGQSVLLSWSPFSAQQPLPEYNTGFSMVAEYTDVYLRRFQSKIVIASLKETFHYGLAEAA
ncbi:MAG: hypothetical protein F4X57_02535 [Chloroflexi bacterium]|nr:hypothetical protein [Chloroflexota bacterium]